MSSKNSKGKTHKEKCKAYRTAGTREINKARKAEKRARKLAKAKAKKAAPEKFVRTPVIAR